MLRYIHEVCQPPIIHQNFKSANILLDDKLAVRVCDCGLAELKPPGYTEVSFGLRFSSGLDYFLNANADISTCSFSMVMVHQS